MNFESGAIRRMSWWWLELKLELAGSVFVRKIDCGLNEFLCADYYLLHRHSFWNDFCWKLKGISTVQFCLIFLFNNLLIFLVSCEFSLHIFSESFSNKNALRKSVCLSIFIQQNLKYFTHLSFYFKRRASNNYSIFIGKLKPS